MRKPWFHQAAFALLGHELLDHSAKLLPRSGRCLLLLDPGAGAHHLRQRPVGHPLSIREAASLMPEAQLFDPVQVLEKLPQQAGLARAGLADNRDVARLAPLHALLAGVDDRLKLALAADERRFQSGAAPSAAGARHNSQRSPCADGLLAPLDLVRA
jgi:hypothetical protein